MSDSLLKKYNIPISHLDFDYIKTCENVREIEKIVLILQSGQEGYYLDLTKCALAKLQSLKPNSKILREEVPVLNKRSMDKEEWNAVSSDIDVWTEKVKKQTERLRENKSNVGHHNDFPIRQYVNEKSSEEDSENARLKRIGSCDYAQWDKYDPDVEMLKMDLNEERDSASMEIKNKKKSTMIDSIRLHELVDKLTTAEKEDIANKHRVKGNEFYKAADYNDAIQEYTLSINIFPTASAFNNRAMTYLKTGNIEVAINDCEECLSLDPNNVKALQRKVQALLNQLKYREAYNECGKILSIDAKNEWVKNKISEIKLKIPDLPPTNAFRMKIMDSEEIIQQKNQNQPKPQTADEFAELIIPTKIIPSKLAKLKSNFVLNKNVERDKERNKKSNLDDCREEDRMIIPSKPLQKKNKITEYHSGVIIEEL